MLVGRPSTGAGSIFKSGPKMEQRKAQEKGYAQYKYKEIYLLIKNKM